MSLPELMSRMPDGTASTLAGGSSIGWPELARFLRDEYWANPRNIARKAAAATRQEFYAGGGDRQMCEMVAAVFADKDVIELRQKWVEHAKYNNVTRRAVHEVATVYSAPALRMVSGEENQARYRRMQQRTGMHGAMQKANRLGYLHRAVFIYPRTRKNASNVQEPVIEVVTPDRFDAIAHPQDPSMLVAISIDLGMKSASMHERLPARLLITASEFAYVNAEHEIMEATITPHAFGRIPGVLYNLDAPGSAAIDSRATDDLESGHRAVWFENILLLKESKSATKSTVFAGDTSTTAKGQASDTERDIILQEGTTASTIDRSMDLSMFRATGREIYETAAANHGIPPMTLAHGGVQSADARELQRAPLKELRAAQQIQLRDVERELAEVQAAVYAPLPDVAFSVDGWTIDFADPQTPLGQLDALTVFDKERSLCLTSTVAEVMRRNPDLSHAAAKELVNAYLNDELWRNTIMRPLQAISGSLGAVVASPDVGRQQPPNAGTEQAAA